MYRRKFGLWITDLTTGASAAVPIDAPAEAEDNSVFFVEDGTVSELLEHKGAFRELYDAARAAEGARHAA